YFNEKIAKPIANYLQTTNVNGTPLKDIIRFVVLVKGVPFRIDARQEDADSRGTNVICANLLTHLSETFENPEALLLYYNNTPNIPNPYFNADGNFTSDYHFIPNHFQTSAFVNGQLRNIPLSYLVTHLSAPRYSDVTGMIDRSKNAIYTKNYVWFTDLDPTPCRSVPTGNPEPVFNSLNIHNYFFDHDEYIYHSYPDSIMSYCSNGIWTTDGNPDTCYAWDYFPEDYIQSQLSFDYASGAFFSSVESHNGLSIGTNPVIRTRGQGLIADFTLKGGTVAVGQAFHSTGSHVIQNNIFFPSYATGYTFIEAAYLGLEKLDATNVVVGDPLTRITYPCEPMILTHNTSISSEDIDCGIIVPEGIILTIEQGSGVNLNSNTSIKVYGNLVINNQAILNLNNYSVLKIFEGGTLTAETGSNLIFNNKSILDNQGILIINPNSSLTLNDNSQFNSAGKLKLLAGANILDNSTGSINITGSIIAEGTLNNPVNFNFTNQTDQLAFASGDSLKLDYTNFNNGGLNISSNTNDTKLLLIENGIFANSVNAVSFDIDVQLADNVDAKLHNVQFLNFNGGGIGANGLRNFELNGCNFTSGYQNSSGIEIKAIKNLVVNNSYFSCSYGVVRGSRTDENNFLVNSENIRIYNCIFNLNTFFETGISTAISVLNNDRLESLSVESCSISGFNTAISLNNLNDLVPLIITNTITNFKSFGISATNGISIKLFDNNISSSDAISSEYKTGVFISNISNPILIRNTIHLLSANIVEGSGIVLVSSNGEIRANNINGFKNGVELGSSSPNIGSNSIISNKNYGIYIGPDSYPDLSATIISDERYPVTGFNTIKENGLCSFYPGYSEIYLSSSYALLKGGCNIIADDRYDPSLQCNHNYLIDGDHVAETINAGENYWGEINNHNPEGRFGQNISVDYGGYLMSPCLFESGTELFIFKDLKGDVYDSLYSTASTPTNLTEIEIKYAEGNEYYYSNDFIQAKQKFLEIIQLSGNDRLSLQAYTKLFEIANSNTYTSEQFLQLKDFYFQKANAQTDSLISSSLLHLGNLCLVSAKEYISAINSFEESVQQNPNTDLALYRQIDALTTSSLLTSDSTLGKMVPSKYKVENILGYSKMISELLRSRGKEGLAMDNQVIPKDFKLYQNYPNPFNPTTTIKFDLPKDGLVNLEIYDILGRRIATLINENKIAGSYEQVFNSASFASGVYIYKIQAGDFLSAKKMILLK
ncbi:MAG: T9SS type A sorting domain-containing protein, partial [Ignavibacteriaceae bacterium]|nr:T9SS type A sorting domain-containing protein [Ignavibacteriaceae bacterium]